MSTGTVTAKPGPGVSALLLTVTLPFGLGYFISYLFRTVNAVIAPQLTSEVGLTAADIGLLTSTYFIVFAAFQLPLGLILDRFGPRRVQTVLLVIGALGAALFAAGRDFTTLAVARGLIGLGVSGCLMAALQANVMAWPRERLPLLNGVTVGFGSFGALVSTVPVELLVREIGWRGVFWLLAAFAALVAVLIWTAAPRRNEAARAESRAPRSGGFRAQLNDLGQIYGSLFFWRLSGMVVIHSAIFLSYQSLWTGSWLRDVAGLDRIGVANSLLMFNVGMFVGALTIGMAAERLQAIGIKPIVSIGGGVLLSISAQALFAFGVTAAPAALCFAYGFFGSSTLLIYAAFGQHFPQRLIGRVNTAQNMLVFFGAFGAQWGIGAIIDLWPAAGAGHFSPEAQTIAMFVMIGLQCAGFVWFLLAGRLGGGRG